MQKTIRPQQTEGPTLRKKTGCGYLYMIDRTNSKYPEFFLKLGKTGGCPAAFLQAVAKICSLGLRRKLEKGDIIRMLNEIGCPNPIWDGPVQILSCPDAISKMLEDGDK